jgi:hypothetical protein
VLISTSIFTRTYNSYAPRTLGMAFFNNSLYLSSGLQIVDDLDFVEYSANIWLQ